MTTLEASNVHAVGVDNCRDGSDDLDTVVTNLFADTNFKQQVNLSSVNSINWGRVLMQAVHYFYAYFQVVDGGGENRFFSSHISIFTENNRQTGRRPLTFSLLPINLFQPEK